MTGLATTDEVVSLLGAVVGMVDQVAGEMHATLSDLRRLLSIEDPEAMVGELAGVHVRRLLLARFRLTGDAELLEQLHQADAPRRLGHSSWRAFCDAELGISHSRSYQLLHALEVRRLLGDLAGPDVTEAQLRPLTPMRHDADRVRDLWRSAALGAAGMPTGDQVQRVVDRATGGDR